MADPGKCFSLFLTGDFEMQIKTPLLIIGSIILLSALIVYLGETPVDSQNGDMPSATNNAGSGELTSHASGDPVPTDSSFNAFYKRINSASGSSEYKDIAYEVIAGAQREQMFMLMELLLGRWVKEDLTAALNFAGFLGDESIREVLLHYALAKGGHVDFPGALDWVIRQSFPDEKKYNLISRLYEGVAKESPEHALQFVDLLDDENFKDHMLRVLLEQWAERDMISALVWMNEQAPSQALDDARASLLFRLVEQNPQEAGALIRNMQPGSQKETLARKYAEALAKSDIESATSWARSLDDPSAYGIALTAVYETWFQNEPDKKIIMEQVLVESDSELRDRLINEVALDMANSNPAELAGMIHQLPETAQADVAEKAVRFWKERSPSETLDWVSSLDAGLVRDRTSRVMAEDLVIKGDRDRALSLAGSIKDESLRYDATKKVVEYWYQANPDEARHVVHGIPFLSEAEKESISSLIQ